MYQTWFYSNLVSSLINATYKVTIKNPTIGHLKLRF